MLIFIIIVSVLGLTNAKYQDYRILDRNGNHMKWFTQLKYTIHNEWHGVYMYDSNWPRKTLDKTDPKFWHSFVKEGKFSGFNGWAIYAHGTFNELLQMDANRPNWPLCHTNGKTLFSCTNCEFTDKDCVWKLNLYPYELNAEIEHFEFETPPQDILKQSGEASLILDQNIDNSKSSAKVSREIKYKYKESSEIEVTHSTTTAKIWKGFANVELKAKLGLDVNFIVPIGYIPALFGISSEFKRKIQFGIEGKYATNTTDGTVTKKSEETTIEENLKVDVSPYQSVRVVAYQYIVKNVQWKYKAKMRISGRGPQWENNGKISPYIIRVLLQKQYPEFDLRELEVNDDSIVFEEKGTIKGSFGSKSFTTVEDIKMVPKNQTHTKRGWCEILCKE